MPDVGEATVRRESAALRERAAPRQGTAPPERPAPLQGTAPPERPAPLQGTAPPEDTAPREDTARPEGAAPAVGATPQVGTAQRAQLSRRRIVGTAVELLEREGEAALSMRRIAAELGFGVMSLYNHVPNKAALLDAISEYVMADLQFAARPRADWRDQTRALVRAFREISRKYPRSVNVVITRQLSSPAGLQPLELALATAHAAGFDGVTAVRVMRSFVAYALGTVINEARLSQRLAGAAEDLDGYVARLDPAEFPNTLALAGTLMEYDPDADFEFGLDLLINAVTALPRTRPLPAAEPSGRAAERVSRRAGEPPSG